MQNFAQTLFDRFNADWDKLTHAEIKSLIRVKSKTTIPSVDEIDLSSRQRVKLGIDPTGSEIHIGHLAPLFVIDIFARTGHHVDFLIGDFTSKIGDPSGRVSERKILTDADIAENYKTYVQQVARFFDVTRWTTRKNSEWLSKISLADVIAITQQRNMASILQRDDFRKRMEDGGLTQAETLYGLLQGMDSVALESTIEIGGLDQLLNLQAGRELQRIHNQPPQAIITTPLLEGLCGTGKKMGKSLNNYISVNASAEDKFGLLMSVPDNLLEQYWTTFAYLFESELTALGEFIKTQPLEAKKQLATYFVAIEAKSIAAGENERAAFEKKFSKRELSDSDFQIIKVQKGEMLLDAIMQSGKFKSKGELKRLLASNSIRNIESNLVISLDFAVVEPIKIKVGKLNFLAIEIV